jgi:hypothetical protein
MVPQFPATGNFAPHCKSRVRHLQKDYQSPKHFVNRYCKIMSDAKIAELEKQIEALTQHVTRLEDVQEIRKVQHKYGYYIDKCLCSLCLQSNTGTTKRLAFLQTLPTRV